MIKIQEENVPTKGIGKYFQIHALNFPMNPASVSFYWQLFDETSIQDGETTKVGPGVSILDGNLSMDETTYASWASDDNYVIDWALNKLGFTKETI
jgi:hypothetical protein